LGAHGELADTVAGNEPLFYRLSLARRRRNNQTERLSRSAVIVLQTGVDWHANRQIGPKR
jgi:hypothetical protein